MVTDLPDYEKKIIIVTPPGEYPAVIQVDLRKILGEDLITPTVAGCVPTSIENAALAYDATNDRFKVDIEALTVGTIPVSLANDWTRQLGLVDLSRVLGAALSHANPVIARLSNGSAFIDPRDVSDRAARLLGIIYGDKGQFAQRTTSLDLYVQLRSAGDEIDPTQIRALTAADEITVDNMITGFATQITLNALNTKIPSDPAKESGKLTTIETNTDDLVKTATTPTLYNVTLTNANTEYSQALPSNTKKFLIQCRDGTAFRLAFVTGKVAAPTEPYWTVVADEVYYEDNVLLTGVTVYMAASVAGKVVEILVWT